MNKDKISSQEIVDLLTVKASVSKKVAEDFIKVFFASIEEALLAGETIKVKNFGTFKLQWNQARKSVNVNTGEVIIINSYPKVVFTPDAPLKNQVNEPFAHLEPVILGKGEIPNAYHLNDAIDEELPLEPLHIFAEQASEIKNIISEIQAISTKKEKSTASNPTPKDDSAKDSPAEASVEEIHQLLSDMDEASNAPEEDSTEQELASSAQFLKNEHTKTKKKKKIKLKWIAFIAFIAVGLGGAGSYLYVPPVTNFANNAFEKFRASDINQTMYNTLMYWNDTIYTWLQPSREKNTPQPQVVVVADTIANDTIKTIAEPIDSLQVLFDSVRVYTEYIASEQMQKGSRLARMSERYYGKSEFWVYIYEANKEKIPNPDNIQIGTLIRIPKLDKRLIDINNPRCLEKAIQLHDVYLSEIN